MVEKSRRNGTQPNLSFSTTSSCYCTHHLWLTSTELEITSATKIARARVIDRLSCQLPRPLQPPTQPPPKAARKMAAPVYSITRAEIDEFWRRKEVEEEERRLAAEKEAARIKAKELKMEDYVLFKQMIGEILKEGNKGDITRNSRMVAAASSSTEARIGIKHWWKRSAYAYLNAPALSMDENGRSKHAMTYVLQERCTRFCPSTPCQPNTTAFVIF